MTRFRPASRAGRSSTSRRSPCRRG
jgi:hypothetical protein